MTHHVSRQTSGFTLLELVVAIGIIVLLAGLLVSATTAMARRSEIRQTESTMKLLTMAVQEWQAEADRNLVRGEHAGADLKPDTEWVFVISEVLRPLRHLDDARAILAGISPDQTYVYHDGDIPPWIQMYPEEHQLPQFYGEMTVLDAWNVPIYATHPGSVTDPAGDLDGTERTANEVAYGSAPQRTMFFVSAGPDQHFGLDREFPGLSGAELATAIDTARADNIYSRQPIWPDAP